MSKKILIVDDEPDILMMQKDALSLEGYECITAVNGKSALEIYERENPGLVILDIMLPDMTGHQVCETIRKNDKDVRIIIVTSKIDAVDAGRAKEAGADDFTVKTSDNEHLLKAIKELIG